MSGFVEFTPTAADQIAANRAWLMRYFSRGAMRWLLILAFLLLTIAAVAGIFAGDWDKVAAPLFFMTVLVVTVVLNWLLVPRRVRRMLAQRPSVTTPTRYVWDDQGVEVTSDAGMSKVRWKELFRWWEHKHGIVFQLSDNMLLVLPGRVLDSIQVEDLRATLLAHGPTRR